MPKHVLFVCNWLPLPTWPKPTPYTIHQSLDHLPKATIFRQSSCWCKVFHLTCTWSCLNLACHFSSSLAKTNHPLPYRLKSVLLTTFDATHSFWVSGHLPILPSFCIGSSSLSLISYYLPSHHPLSTCFSNQSTAIVAPADNVSNSNGSTQQILRALARAFQAQQGSDAHCL